MHLIQEIFAQLMPGNNVLLNIIELNYIRIEIHPHICCLLLLTLLIKAESCQVSIQTDQISFHFLVEFLRVEIIKHPFAEALNVLIDYHRGA